MPYKPIEIEKMLKNKLKMDVEDADHRWFILELEGLPRIRTKLSNNKNEVGDFLESRICKQLRVRKNFFHELIDCTKSRDEYKKQIQDDPFPPFSQLLV